MKYCYLFLAIIVSLFACQQKARIYSKNLTNQQFNKIDTLYSYQNYAQVLNETDTLLKMYAANQDQDSLLLAYTYFIMPALSDMNKLDSFIHYLPKLRPYLSYKSNFTADIYRGLATSFVKNMQIDSARFYFKQARKYIECVDNKVDKESSLMGIYNEEAYFYQEIGEYKAAENLLHKVIQSLQPYKDSVNKMALLNARGTYIYNLTKREAWEKVEQEKQKALHLGLSERNLSQFCHNLAHFYLYHPTQPNYDSAEFYVLKKIKIQAENQDLAEAERGRSLKLLGEVYYHQQKYQEAVKQLEKAVQLRQKDQMGLAATYLVLAKVYGKLKAPDKALQFIEKGLEQFKNREKEGNIYQELQIKEITFPDYAFQLWAEKVAILQKKKSYEKALLVCAKIDSLVDNMRVTFVSDESKLIWAGKVSHIYEKAISLAIQAKQPEKAFHFAEKNKGFILYTALKSVEINNIPPALFAKQQQLYQQFYLAQNQAKNSEKVNLVAELTQKLAQLKLALAKYPEYYRLQYDTKTDSLVTLQRNLPQDHALIHYQLNEGESFAFVITPKQIKVQKLAKINEELLLNFRKELETSTDQPLVYQKLAYQLYQKLIAPISAFAPEKHWIIIPDKQLNYLPFEAFLTQKTKQNNYQKLPYFLYHKSISYHYSATLWHYLQNKKLQKGLTHAPYFSCVANSFQQKGLGILPANKVKKLIRDVFGLGDTLAAQHKADFQQKFQKETNEHYPLSVIFTHSEANDMQADSSWIAFEDKKLYLSEVFALHFSTDLLILSSCKSGTGNLQKGEGLMSLARGFMYIGASNLLPTHWKVEPNKNVEFLRLFIPLLKAGNRKDEALQIAKIIYLQQNLQARPKDWAAPFLIGDTRAIL
ncbi:MAG: CHAT domain-containing protein [Bacteroidia bacterium]